MYWKGSQSTVHNQYTVAQSSKGEGMQKVLCTICVGACVCVCVCVEISVLLMMRLEREGTGRNLVQDQNYWFKHPLLKL